jgi:hypothetical protein
MLRNILRTALPGVAAVLVYLWLPTGSGWIEDMIGASLYLPVPYFGIPWLTVMIAIETAVQLLCMPVIAITLWKLYALPRGFRHGAVARLVIAILILGMAIKAYTFFTVRHWLLADGAPERFFTTVGAPVALAAIFMLWLRYSAPPPSHRRMTARQVDQGLEERSLSRDPITGEYQRVTYRSDDAALVDATPRLAREMTAVEESKHRMSFVKLGAPAAVGGVIAFLWAIRSRSPDIAFWESLGTLALLMGLILGAAAMTALIKEMLYQTGYQRMIGAMALDPEQPESSSREVEEQQAHGKARTATEEEVRKAASGNIRRSAVHDQKF